MIKVGILGGGQLGRMLLQAAVNYPVETYLMEHESDCPAAHLCHHFTKGNITSFEDVYQFGKGLDAITIEIEKVNDAALEKLEGEGIRIYPKPRALATIKNKIAQKHFYTENQIPTAPYVVTTNIRDLYAKEDFLPAVHKIAEGGYDGRGVQIIKTRADIDQGFEGPAVLEKLVDIQKEIAQIIAVDDHGKTAVYPPVEMIFDPYLNILDYQISPANLAKEVLWKVEAIALKVAKDFKSPGLFAVEFLIGKNNEVFVNETAPRVHNSGHHTIEANYSSQFDMLWRIILGYPLGNPLSVCPAALVNVLGAIGQEGEAVYDGISNVLQMDNVFVHVYGKKQTKPGRKMGHVTIVAKEKSDLVFAVHKVKQLMRVITH